MFAAYQLYPLPEQTPPPPRRADVEAARADLASAQARLADTPNAAVAAHAAEALGVTWLLPHFDVATAPELRTSGFYVMCELLSEMKELARPGAALLLCEGPGGFVHALLHHDPHRSWHAMTLSTGGGTAGVSSPAGGSSSSSSAAALGDAQPLAPALLAAKKGNGHARAVFGADGTGDLTHLPNANSLLIESHAGTAQLVTADGGTAGGARLVAAQVAVALRALRPGGHLILRLDLPLAAEVEGLVRVAAECFARCDVARPSSLLPTVATAYLVGCDYKGAGQCANAVEACWAAAFSPEGSLPTAAPPLLAHAELQIVRAAATVCADAADLAAYLAAQAGGSSDGAAAVVAAHAARLRAAAPQARRARAWLERCGL